MKHGRMLFGVLGAGALLLSGCGDDDGGGGATSLDVTAVDFAFDGLPEEVESGLVEVSPSRTTARPITRSHSSRSATPTSRSSSKTSVL